MSATRRPGGGEDNILARLEREGMRGKPVAPWRQTWVVWSGLAAVAIIGLVATLASLARENLTVHRPPVVIEANAAPDPFAERDNGAALMHDSFAPLPPSSTQPKAPVADMRSERPRAKTDEPALPPLVMLKPPAPVPAPAKPAAPQVTRNAPAKPSSRSASAKPAAAPARKSAPVPLAKSAPVRPIAVAAAPPHSVAPVVRPKKTASTPATASAEPVDSDVALLSAILMHASRHAGERAQIEAARCGAGKKCAPASDAPTSPKATD